MQAPHLFIPFNYAIIKTMDNPFNQINDLLRQEMTANKKRLKKSHFLFALPAIFTIIFLISSFLFATSTPFSQGQTVVDAIKKTGASFGAAIIGAPADFLNLFTPKTSTNFLLLGIPGPGNDAPDLTDTILLANVKQDPFKITFISIPRDLWVKIPETSIYTKINTLYSFGKTRKDENYGLSLIKDKIEEVTGQKIDYYFLADVSVVKKIIDSVGGINVLVKKDLIDTQFPGPNHSYETFEVKSGWRYLDGETASKYVRSRHTTTGDFDRMERQQEILEALKQKIAGMNPVWDLPAIVDIAGKVWNNIETNASLADLPGFWQTAKKISSDNINKIVFDNELVVSQNIPLEGITASTLIPKAGLENYSKIQKYIGENL